MEDLKEYIITKTIDTYLEDRKNGISHELSLLLIDKMWKDTDCFEEFQLAKEDIINRVEEDENNSKR